MKMIKTAIKGKKTVKSVPAKALVFVFLVFLALLSAIIIYIKNRQAERILMIQKPVDSVALPAGMKMNNLPGYTIFESEAYGIPAYSFVKYRESWKENAFFKADLTIMPFKEAGIVDMEIPLDDSGLNATLAAKKIQLMDQRDRESGEGKKVSYETDYREFQPENSASFDVSGRKWSRFNLFKYEDTGAGSQIKTWNNIYTVYRDKIVIIDYVIYRGLIINKSRKTDTYDEVLKEIEKDVMAMIQGMYFK